MKTKILQEQFSTILFKEGLKYKSHQTLTGGDSNQVYILTTTNKSKLVVKVNGKQNSQDLFTQEAIGLNELRLSKSFVIPEVISTSKIGNKNYLLLEYLPPNKKETDHEQFGIKLAKMHACHQNYYGFSDNYIGILTQKNKSEKTAADFYINQRLQPQFNLALENGFHFQKLETLFSKIYDLIPDEKASLIHGDLWNGNYLSTIKGFALIDPAVSYSIREMDLAMMQLFGGFSDKVFEVYHYHFPLLPKAKQRLKLYQLYYLLVHLNLFGSAYLPSVTNCIKKYIS